MDRIDHINELLEDTDFKSTRKQSIIVNNFFSLITIIMMSIAIILYVNYVVPAQEAKKAREEKKIKHQEYLDLRAKQIALSHKLNSPVETKKEDINATK
ncbi:MAG: hypothetical protein U9R39_10590 [Campylobacterota bacterium]|nr:hypothetical protein [Campylobacterota bacterium]